MNFLGRCSWPLGAGRSVPIQREFCSAFASAPTASMLARLCERPAVLRRLGCGPRGFDSSRIAGPVREGDYTEKKKKQANQPKTGTDIFSNLARPLPLEECRISRQKPAHGCEPAALGLESPRVRMFLVDLVDFLAGNLKQSNRIDGVGSRSYGVCDTDVGLRQGPVRDFVSRSLSLLLHGDPDWSGYALPPPPDNWSCCRSHRSNAMDLTRSPENNVSLSGFWCSFPVTSHSCRGFRQCSHRTPPTR